MAQSMKPGGGGRFNALQAALDRQGARNPRALAAFIGAKKYGKKKMGQMAAAGRQRAQGQ